MVGVELAKMQLQVTTDCLLFSDFKKEREFLNLQNLKFDSNRMQHN